MKWCTLLLLAALPSLAQDSPLVAAAKRCKQTEKKATMVITNDTLVRSNASVHLTTTRKQPALAKTTPVVKEKKREPEQQRAAADPKPPAPPPLEDAVIYEENDPARGDLVNCPTCLPILEPVNASLPLRKAEFSANPPHEAEPQKPAVVTPRVPKP